jgi:MFS family permease
MIKKMIATDWLAIKSRSWQNLIAIGLFIISIFIVNTAGILCALLAAFIAQGGSSDPFIVEEKGKLQQFYLSLPLSRKDIVKGRYAFMLTYVFATMLLFILLDLIVTPGFEAENFRFNETPIFTIMVSFIGFALSGFFNIISYPILFRFGYEKGQILGFIIPMILFGILFGTFFGFFMHVNNIERAQIFLEYISENTQAVMIYITLISLGIGLLLYFGSYCISQRVYRGRSF